jgi:hypothetical protein
MDTSYWTALNPNILRLDTIKLMHSRYVHRLAVRAVGCSILRNSQDVDAAIEFRNNNYKNYNWGGSWRRKPVTKEDASLLKLIGEQIHHEEMSPRVKGMETIKIRIEEPDVQFYASDEKSLIGIANKLKFGDNSHFISIMTPAQKEHEKFLLDGFTLRKTKVLWPYRVLFRDGKYSSETKAQIASYLRNLEDQIKVPRNLWEQLEKGAWIWGGYVYVHDKSLALMLGLIDGRLISKIEEFKVVEKQE